MKTSPAGDTSHSSSLFSTYLPPGERTWDPLPSRGLRGFSVWFQLPIPPPAPKGAPPMAGHHYHFSMMWLM